MPIYKSKDKTKDGRQYYFTYSYKEDGKYKTYKSKKFATKREADLAQAQFLLVKGKQKEEEITFDLLVQEYLASAKKSVKPQTVLYYEFGLKPLLTLYGDMPISKFTPAHYDKLREYIDGLGYSASNKNMILRYTKRILKLANTLHGINVYSPYYDQRYKTEHREMQFYTYDEWLLFEQQIVNEPIYHCFFTLAFFNGLRASENLALTWEDIDFVNKTVRINKTITRTVRDKGKMYRTNTPKTKRSIRTLPLTKRPLEALKTLYEYYSRFDGFNKKWFLYGGIAPMYITAFRRRKNIAAKAAGLPQIRIHDFRHSCCAFLLDKVPNMNIALISAFLGHENVSTTLNIYAHFYQSNYALITETINNLT